MSSDIEYVCHRLDQFYADAVQDGYPFLWLDSDEVPDAMVSQVDQNGAVLWKMLPSTVNQKQINNLELNIGHRLPPMYRAYLRSQFHLFSYLHPYDIIDDCNGHRMGTVTISPYPCDEPLKQLRRSIQPSATNLNSMLNFEWNSALFEYYLFQAGFITIGWSIGERIVLDTHFPTEESDYEVAVITEAFSDSVYQKSTKDIISFSAIDVSDYRYRLCSSFREFVDRFITYPSDYKC